MNRLRHLMAAIVGVITVLLTLLLCCATELYAQEEHIDVSMTQKVFPDVDLRPDQPLVYSLYITNHSAITVSNIIVSDILPAQVVSTTIISTSNGSHIQEVGGYPNFGWQIDNLAPKTQVDIYIIGRIAEHLNETVTMSNVAEVYALGDLFLSNNHTTINSRVVVPQVSFANEAIRVQEQNTTIHFPVVLELVNPYGSASVDYALTPDPTTPGAAIPDDIASISGTLFMTAATTYEEHIDLEIFDDLLNEDHERFRLTLSNPRGASLGEKNELVITIEDDDPTAQGVQSVLTEEDTAVEIGLALAANESLQAPITVTVDGSGTTNGQLHSLSVSDALSARATYTPTANFAGQDWFTYVVSDAVGQSISGRVEILVTAVNDQPVIEGQYFEIHATDPAGTVVGIVKATDPDEGQSLTYRITGINLTTIPSLVPPCYDAPKAASASPFPTVPFFTIDPVSGEIATSGALMQIQGTGYRLHVQVTDNGIPVQSSSAWISINAKYLNNPPVLTEKIPDQEVPVGQVFRLSITHNSFVDLDANGLVFVSKVTLVDGSALPEWLTFNDATCVLSGRPLAPDELDIRVTVRDLFGGTSSTVFSLRVSTGATRQLHFPLYFSEPRAVAD